MKRKSEQLKDRIRLRACVASPRSRVHRLRAPTSKVWPHGTHGDGDDMRDPEALFSNSPGAVDTGGRGREGLLPLKLPHSAL